MGNSKHHHTHTHTQVIGQGRVQTVGIHYVVQEDLMRKDAYKLNGLPLLCVKGGLPNRKAILLLCFCNAAFLTSDQQP